MPAKSEKQRRYMGMMLSRQRKMGSNDTGMNEGQLRDFARKPSARNGNRNGGSRNGNRSY